MKKLDMSMLKKAIEDILVRKPDLDEGKQPPKAEDPDDGTSKAPNPKADVSSDSPEQAVTDKAAWDSLSDSEQTYVASFVATCKQAGVDPALFVAPELLKWAQLSPAVAPVPAAAAAAAPKPPRDPNRPWGAMGGAATGALIGSAIPGIGTLAGVGIGAIMGHNRRSQYDSLQNQINAKAPAAPQPPAIPVAPAQPQPAPKMAAYVAAFVETCKQAGLTDAQAQALLGVKK